MTKVHPNATTAEASVASTSSSPCITREPTVLTVWRKSLLFNCRGFTVFDSNGNLVYRVDNYLAGNKDVVALMDADGAPVLTLRRKKLTVGDNWHVYDGEETTNPRFSAKKLVNLPCSRSKDIARVTTCTKGGNASSDNDRWECVVEGSYTNRACAVYDSNRCVVAEIQRKEAASGVTLGDDVFRMVVNPGMDTAVAMAVVLLLDQMFGSRPR